EGEEEKIKLGDHDELIRKIVKGGGAAGAGSSRRFAKAEDEQKGSMWDENGNWVGEERDPETGAVVRKIPLPPKIVKGSSVRFGCEKVAHYQVSAEGSFDYSPAFLGSSLQVAIDAAYSHMASEDFASEIDKQIFGDESEIKTLIRGFIVCDSDCPRLIEKMIHQSSVIEATVTTGPVREFPKGDSADTEVRTDEGDKHVHARSGSKDAYKASDDKSKTRTGAYIKVNWKVLAYYSIECVAGEANNQGGAAQGEGVAE
ncbi:MAG: hypothetical protein KDB07_06005, partial [Planctomycetes bacterium]|nr:hypothetical protein [Planctomycetota bacterium]